MLLFTVGCFLLSFTIPDFGKTMRWEIIGHKKVSPKQDKVEIPVKVLTNKSSALRFSINAGDLYIHHSKVYFDDGEFQTIPLRRKYFSGNLSKIVDLRGGIRSIVKCEVFFTPDRLAKEQPIIELWAKTEFNEGLADNK